MKYKVLVKDDNQNQLCSFDADDESGISNLVEFVKIAAGTPRYENFNRNGVVVVEDQAGKEIARADYRTGWELSPPLK